MTLITDGEVRIERSPTGDVVITRRDNDQTVTIPPDVERPLRLLFDLEA